MKIAKWVLCPAVTSRTVLPERTDIVNPSGKLVTRLPFERNASKTGVFNEMCILLAFVIKKLPATKINATRLRGSRTCFIKDFIRLRI